MEFEVGIGRGEGEVVMIMELDRATKGNHGKMSDQKAAEGHDYQECFVLQIKIVYIAINFYEFENRTF